MKSHVRVAVIGGGVVGCSVLYHLTRLGWSDVMLIERSELTSGSTWHAAGGFHTRNADTNMAALQGYTIRLYRELEELTGQSCGLHHVGGLTLTSDADCLDFLKAERAKHRYMGSIPRSWGRRRSRGSPRSRTPEDCSGRSTIRSTVTSTPRAPPRHMRGARACRGRRSCCAIQCASSTRAPTTAGTW